MTIKEFEKNSVETAIRAYELVRSPSWTKAANYANHIAYTESRKFNIASSGCDRFAIDMNFGILSNSYDVGRWRAILFIRPMPGFSHVEVNKKLVELAPLFDGFKFKRANNGRLYFNFHANATIEDVVAEVKKLTEFIDSNFDMLKDAVEKIAV